MRASQFFISTLKEAPADAEVVSHQLMMRAGLIKRLGSGCDRFSDLQTGAGSRSIPCVQAEPKRVDQNLNDW